MVGVVIPVFNRSSRLRRAVQSVLRQDGAEFSLVVVDDASTRDLGEVRQWVEGAGHSWIRQKINSGPAAARNVGVAALPPEAQWLAFLDSDDEWRQGKLAAQIRWHEEHPEAVISQCRELWMRAGLPARRPVRLLEPAGEIFADCVNRCCISPSAVMLRRDLFESLGGFRESYRVCEDYHLWLRIARLHPVGLIDEPLVIKHGGGADQLTNTVPAFDRWRLRALLDLLVETPDLSAEQCGVVLLGIRDKARILERGAAKQDRSDAAEYYRSVEFWAGSVAADSLEQGEVMEMLEKLKAFLSSC